MNINLINSKSTQDEITIRKITDRYGTPLYIYDTAKIKENFTALKQCFPEYVDIFYSIKANPNVSIAAFLRSCGAGAEVSSLAELELVLKAGFSAGNILAVGPYKSLAFLKKCLVAKVHAIVCESKQEVDEVALLAQELGSTANIMIRINPAMSASEAPLKMGGVASQFGIDEEQIVKDAKFYFNKRNIKVIGIHVYNGSRILDAKAIYYNTTYILELVATLAKQWQQTFSTVDIGGGIGIPYFNNETTLDLSELHQLLQPLLANFRSNHPNVRIILESGRYLVGTAGMLIASVCNLKHSRGKNFLITDAGTHCHMAATGIGSFVKRNFPIAAITNQKTQKQESYEIVGSLCTPGDILAKNINLPLMQTGDLIVIKNSGAYGPSASPVKFLSHGHPTEVLINNGKDYLIRKCDTVSDILNKQILLEQFN